MKVLVCGGQASEGIDRLRVFAALEKAHAKRPITQVIHGSSGAGKAAKEWAELNGVLAGAVVSGDPMACSPDGLIAFAGAPASMLAAAESAGVRVWWPYGSPAAGVTP